ncbi:MAG: hypothetical protein L0Z07_02715, partial [Planctomycetes bacterium]|nr:hypothetical protein [Planctomycetota bacterium]
DFYHFHVNLFADPQPGSFAVTWEEAAARLEGLPRMIFELDGSFVVRGSVGPARWQVDGHLFDFSDRLHRVELHGDCPRSAFDELLECVGWPAQRLVFEMVREGTTLDEQEFRRQVRANDAPIR